MKSYTIKVTLTNGQVIERTEEASSKGDLYRSVILRAQDPEDIASIEIADEDNTPLDEYVARYKMLLQDAQRFVRDTDPTCYLELRLRAKQLRTKAQQKYSVDAFTKESLKQRNRY